MPELPDVQYYVDYFNQNCLGRKVNQVKITEPTLLKKGSPREIYEALTGKKFSASRRRGKFMIVEIGGDPHKLIFHYGMTGDIKYGPRDKLTADDRKFARLVIGFDNGYDLLWINIRKLGKIYFVRDINEVDLLKGMGPEPLELTEKQFLALLEGHKTKNIKSFLMDQSDIAGIGNEYSNEILFQAGIDPHRTIALLAEDEKRNLYRTTDRVLRRGIAAKPGPLPDDWITAKKRKECPKDGNHRLIKETIAGRSAVFCPQHQSVD